MQKKWLMPPVLLLIAGLVGGVVRYLHLTKGFDVLHLPVEGTSYGPFLTVLAVIVLVLFAAASAALRLKKCPCLQNLVINNAPKATLMPAAAGTAVAAVTAVKLLADAVEAASVWGVLNGLLLLLSAAVALPVVRKLALGADADSSVSSLSLVIVFWASFHLIEIYRSVSANPAIGIYLCDLAAMISMILMFFSVSGYLCQKVSAVRVYLMSTAYFFFGTQALVGKGLLCVRAVLNGSMPTAADFADTCVFFFGLACAVSIACTFFVSVEKSRYDDDE